MSDDDSREIDAFFLKDALLFQAAPAVGVSVSRDGNARASMRNGNGAKHSFNARSHALHVGRAFEDTRFHARVADAFYDVANKHIDPQFGSAKPRARAAIVEIHRHFVVGVDPGCHYDVEIGLYRDSLYSRNVTSEADDGQVNDRLDASRPHLIEFRDG